MFKDDRARNADGLLDMIEDRAASRRSERDRADRAGDRWKPTLGLVLPSGFSIERTTHRRDLEAALSVLSAVLDQYRLLVIGDGPDADRIAGPAVPYSPEAVASCAGAIVVGDRTRHAEIDAIRPSRRVADDPIAFRAEARRIVFEGSGIAWPGPPSTAIEVARTLEGPVWAFVDDAPDLDDYLRDLRVIASSGPEVRIARSTRVDGPIIERIRAQVDGARGITLVEPSAVPAFAISNEPMALLAGNPAGSGPRFLHRSGQFEPIGPIGPRRTDLYLLRGEEWNAPALLDLWLGSGPAGTPRTAVIEPLVSVVVPVFDRALELIRLARSIGSQEYPWIEVVFVCNGSPPETIRAIRSAEGHLMARRYRVRRIELAKPFGSATIPRDVGIRASNGDYICVLDSDDWLEAGFFGFLADGRARLDTLYYPRKVFRDFGRSMRDDFPFNRLIEGPGTFEADALPEALERLGNFLCNSGVCLSRALFERAGGIDHRLDYGEDLYLWWRCARAGARAEPIDGTVNVALHPGNNELNVGVEGRLEAAAGLARSREMTEWI